MNSDEKRRKHAEYCKLWRLRNKAKVRASSAKYRATHKPKPELLKKNRANYQQRHREKHLAHRAVEEAVRMGRIIKPTACPRCNSDKLIEAHHKDYTMRYEIEWMCRTCHRREHD